MKLRFAMGLGLAIGLAVLAGAAHAAKGGVFEGAWEAVDFDRGNRWMWIRNFSGVYEVLAYDEACSCCGNESSDFFYPCMAIASGRVSGRHLAMDGGVVTCFRPAGLDVFTTAWEPDFNFVPGKGLVDEIGVTWVPSNNKRPEKVVPPNSPWLSR